MTTVAEVAQQLEPLSSKNFKFRIRPFVEAHGERDVGDVTVLDMIGYREALAKNYAAWTAIGYLTSAKKLVRWSASVGLRDAIDFTAVAPIKAGPPKQRAWTVEQVQTMLSVSRTLDARVEPFLRLAYLACLRPSETLHIVRGEYLEASESLLILENHKTAHKGQPRYVVMSEFAKVALHEARRAKGKRAGRSKDSRCPWARLDGYSNAVAKATGGKRPHRLRHSAATSLLDKGVDRRDVDLLLGHSVGNRISLTYMRVLEKEYERLLPSVRLLAEDLSENLPIRS